MTNDDPNRITATDLRLGYSHLRTEAAQGFPYAIALLAELDRLKTENKALKRQLRTKGKR